MLELRSWYVRSKHGLDGLHPVSCGQLLRGRGALIVDGVRLGKICLGRGSVRLHSLFLGHFPGVDGGDELR